MRQILTDIKGEIDSNTITVGDFNTPVTPMDRSSKQKTNKEIQILNETRWDGSQWYLQDISSKFRRIHLLLKCTRNILQDRPQISWVTNQTSVNLRKLKSYQHLLQPQCYETRYQLQEKNFKKHKHMEIKQHVSK